MMSINFRKMLCPLFKKGKWLYRLFDCKRYEPPEPKTVWLAICSVSQAMANAYCPESAVEDVEFVVGEQPTAYCFYHKKPDPIPKLDKDMVNTDKKVSPYFLKGLPVNHGEATDEEVRVFANTITKQNHGNKLRFLVGCNGRYCEEHKAIIHPFFNEVDGKADLTSINPAWLDSFKRRVGYFIERDWLVELDFYNHSDMNSREEWAIHPLNKNNNHGFYVPEIGRVHPTHEEADSYKGAFRLWDGVGPGKLWTDKPEYNYQSEDDMTEAHRFDMNCNRAIREFNQYHIDTMLDICTSEWGDNFWVGHNEWRSRQQWHLNVMSPIYTAHGIPKERRETSFLPDCWDWPISGAEVFKKNTGYMARIHCIYSEDVVSIPGLGEMSLDDYVLGYLPHDVVFMFSSDGTGWKQKNWDRWGRDLVKLKAVVKRCLSIGRGYELNSDFISKGLLGIDYEAGNTCGEALREWLNEYT